MRDLTQGTTSGGFRQRKRVFSSLFLWYSGNCRKLRYCSKWGIRFASTQTTFITDEDQNTKICTTKNFSLLGSLSSESGFFFFVVVIFFVDLRLLRNPHGTICCPDDYWKGNFFPSPGHFVFGCCSLLCWWWCALCWMSLSLSVFGTEEPINTLCQPETLHASLKVHKRYVFTQQRYKQSCWIELTLLEFKTHAYISKWNCKVLL